MAGQNFQIAIIIRVVHGALTDDPDRLAADRGVIGHVLAGRFTLENPCRAGSSDLGQHRRNLFGRGHVNRLAGVAALGGDQALGMALHVVGEGQQGLLALRGVVFFQSANAADAAA